MALIADELRGLMSLMTLGAGDRAKVRVVVIDIAAGCLLSKLFIASAMTLEAVLRRDVFGAGRSRIVTGLAFHPLRYMAVSEKVLRTGDARKTPARSAVAKVRNFMQLS